MVPPKDLRRLQHMLEHATETVRMAQGRSRSDLDTDRQLNLSLVRLLEIVGEAAARVSQELRENHPVIPWQDMIGLRNRLIHGYDAVDFDILWDIVKRDVPELISQLEQILGQVGEPATGSFRFTKRRLRNSGNSGIPGTPYPINW